MLIALAQSHSFLLPKQLEKQRQEEQATAASGTTAPSSSGTGSKQAQQRDKPSKKVTGTSSTAPAVYQAIPADQTKAVQDAGSESKSPETDLELESPEIDLSNKDGTTVLQESAGDAKLVDPQESS